MANVPHGGPANISGVIYQMLWGLLHTTTLYISGYARREDSGAPDSAVLRLEPIGGGGDHRIIGDAKVIVEQVKARSSGGTWSLREIIEEVLPDLFKAVDLSAPDAEYRFVTESRMGDWGKVYGFFQSLKGRTYHADAVEGLDDAKELPFSFKIAKSAAAEGEVPDSFWPADHYTERSLFKRIAEELRKHPSIKDPGARLHQKLWHLLGRFFIEQEQSAMLVEGKVRRALLDLGVKDVDISPTLAAMLMDLQQRAASGNAEVRSAEFLAKYNLDAVPLTNWRELRRQGEAHLRGVLGRRGYDESGDVRRRLGETMVDGWPEDRPVLVLSGESGQGKSWLMSAASLACAARMELSVLIEATGDADGDQNLAAKTIWEDIKNNDDTRSLKRIAARRKELLPNAPQPWLTLFVDDIQSVKEARGLARAPWEEWGIRLAISCAPWIAKTVKRAIAERVAVHDVPDFSVGELQAFLTQNLGEDWPDIPLDVRDTLRRPILARLYSEVAKECAWQPTNEYELYERYWQRLGQDEQAEYALDAVGIQQLAGSLLEGAPYPWSKEQIARASLDNAAVVRLQRVGWLRAAGDCLEVWHDRLLNWAVAKSLAEAVRRRRIDSEALCRLVRPLFEAHRTHQGRNLGYVPMDLMWLLADPNSGCANVIDNVIANLEGGSFGLQESLYHKLLPTLGTRIVPALYRRLETVVQSEDSMAASQVIGAIAFFSAEDVSPQAMKLLHHDRPFVQRAGMCILVSRPHPDALDQLWKLHCAIEANPQAYLHAHEYSMAAYENSFDAMRACVQLRPDWLRMAIHKADPAMEPVHSLAYLLANLRDGGSLWRGCKKALFLKVKPEKERSLASNIFRYRDAEELSWLLERIDRKDDVLGPTAFRALARIAPERAVKAMGRLDKSAMYATRKWWLPHLIARAPQATWAQVRQLMTEETRPWTVGLVFQGSENALDAQTLELLLDELERLLDRALAGQIPDGHRPLYVPLLMLSAIQRLDLLDCCARRQDKPLEEKLTAWLLSLGARIGVGVDCLERAPGIDVLYKIGGRGFTRVVNSLLSANSRYGRHDGLDHAAKRADADTIAHLVRISLQEELWEGHPVEQGHAARALISLGRAREAVEAIVQWGIRIDAKVIDLVEAEAPLDDGAMEPAFKAIAATGPVLPGAVQAVGIGRRPDKLAAVYSILEKAPCDSDTALAGILTIGRLRDDSKRGLDFLRAQLAIPAHRDAACVALARIGSEEAMSLLLSHIVDNWNVRFAGVLLDDRRTRSSACALLMRHLGSEDWFERPEILGWTLPSCSDEAMQTILEDAELQETLREEAFSASRVFRYVGAKAGAIRCLSRFDAEAAFLAARKAMENPQSVDRTWYPYLLMELDQGRAVQTLLSQVIQERATAVLWAIGRALQDVDVAKTLDEWFTSDDPRKRLSACQLVGWAEPSAQVLASVHRLLDDSDQQVASAAQDALDRCSNQREVGKLADAVVTETKPDRRWILLDALIMLGDPGDDGGSRPAWCLAVSKALPPAMRQYLGERVQERRKALAKEAEESDRRAGRG